MNMVSGGSSLRYALRGVALVLTLATAGLCQADMLGFRLSATHWQQDASGQVRADGPWLNLKHDLRIDDRSSQDFELLVEHPVPLLPNVRVAHTRMALSGNSVLNRAVQFDGQTFNQGTAIRSELDLTHTDATFYYELLDNWLSLDAGLTIRHFSGDTHLRSASARASADYAKTVGLIYLSGRAELPLTGLYVGANGNGLHFGSSQLYDYRVHLGYETRTGLGAELGIRRFRLDYSDSGDKADVDVDGTYFSLFYHF